MRKKFLLTLTYIATMACFLCGKAIFANTKYCLKNNSQTKMSFSEALSIASSEDSACKKIGKLKDEHWCNETTGTWWISIDTNIKNCSPACVIDVTNKKATVNYMCLGLLPNHKRSTTHDTK